MELSIRPSPVCRLIVALLITGAGCDRVVVPPPP